MTSTLFQQFLSLLKEAQQEQDNADITTYDILADVIFQEVEENLSFFSHRFDQIFALFYQLLQTYQTEGTTLSVCSNIYEIFIVMMERRPVLINKNQNRLLNLVQKAFEMFNLVDIQSDQNWMRPPEGYSDETDFSEENTLTKQIMSYVDRIANTYGYSKFIEFFLLVLPNWWTASANNWKARYSLLMFMSQLGENIEYPLTIKPFVDCGIQSVSHPNPKVRYGALQMFGQLADDMKPDFQETYGERLMPVILGSMKDQVPRVHGHAMACLTNFLEEFENQNYHILSPYVDEIINVAESFCHNGISIVKENTISALASLSTIKLLSSAQVEKILSIINFLLTLEQHQKPEYNQLMNQTVECLTMILYGQKDKVTNVFTQSVNVLKSLKTRISATYLVNSWSRVCLNYENFTDLSDIFPEILHSVAIMIENYESQVDAGIKSIQNTINSFKGNIKPYANDIIQLCKNGTVKLHEDSKLKASLYQVLDALVITLKNQAPDPQWEEMSKNVFHFLYQEVQNTLNQQANEEIADVDSLQEALTALQKCISHVNNLFTGQNTTTFSQSIFTFATKVNELIGKIKLQLQTINQEVQEVEDQIEKEDFNEAIKLHEQNVQKLYTARLVIPDIFESVLKVSTKQSQAIIVQSLYPYVSGFLNSDLSHEDIRYGLYFLCDFLTALNYEGIQEHANVYESKFTQFCLSPNLEVRNCAVFGLGEFMKMIPVEKTDQNLIYKWLNLLWNSLSLSSQEHSDKKKFNFARDNIVSALGKLIFSKRSAYPNALNQQVHQKWFENLPLNHDKAQGNIQHEILLRLLEITPETFISTKQDVQKLLIIFAKYFTKRMQKTQDLVVKNKRETKDYLFKIKDWPIFQQNSDFLWNNLSANQKEILTQLMSAP